MLSLALFALSAYAGDASYSEVDLELGRIGAQDPNWEVFDSGTRLGSYGVRAGYDLTNSLSVLVSWHHNVSGGRIEVGGDSGYDEDGYAFNLALTTDQVALGPKVVLDFVPQLTPYATVQAVALRVAIKLDDNPREDDNLNQLRGTGIAPGGIAALGVDVIPAPADQKVRPASHLEMGYAYLTPLELGEEGAMGDLQFKGFYLHWGVGLRF